MSVLDGERLLPFIRTAQSELSQLDPEALAHRCGCQYREVAAGEGELLVPFLGRVYVVEFPCLEVTLAGGEDALDDLTWLQALFLHYFRTADGTPPVGEWVSLRDLPGGLHYARASQGYCGDRLARAFGNRPDDLTRAARRIGGQREPVGDVGFSFVVLPRVSLAVAYWLGDEEFPPSARVLFDRSASHYLPTDALSVLGGELCTRLVNTLPEV